MSSRDNAKMNIPILIIIMILTGVFGLISTDIYAPSLPLIPHLFNTSATFAQLTVSLFLAGFAPTQLLAGMLSDSYGRKPILIYGVFIFMLGTILCIFATSIMTLLLGRIVEGIGAGAIGVISRILLRDTFSGLQMARVGSYLAAFIGLSPALAPVIGGIIQQKFGFPAIFMFLLLFAVILLYLILCHLPETNRFRHLHPLSRKTIIKNYSLVLSCKVFWSNVIATGCGVSIIIACSTINPFLLQNTLKISPAYYGILAFVAMSGMFIGMIINGFFVSKVGGQNMILLGKGTILLVGSSLIFFSMYSALTVMNIVVPTFMITLATAFILPNAVVGAFTPFPQLAGTVGAVYGCLQILITACISAFIALFAEPSQLLLGGLCVVVIVISMGFYFILEKKPSLTIVTQSL